MDTTFANLTAQRLSKGSIMFPISYLPPPDSPSLSSVAAGGSSAYLSVAVSKYITQSHATLQIGPFKYGRFLEWFFSCPVWRANDKVTATNGQHWHFRRWHGKHQNRLP
jgi:hypothetical protein